ncbi:MAG: hypothetical protein ACO1SX_08180 [Actinomycetota bacterium]
MTRTEERDFLARQLQATLLAESACRRAIAVVLEVQGEARSLGVDAKEELDRIGDALGGLELEFMQARLTARNSLVLTDWTKGVSE